MCLVVPSRPCHLRAIRLVATEAGGRAGLDASELDDLRIAVDELCYALMEVSDERLLFRVVVGGRRVVARGPAQRRRGAPAPSLANVSELIVDAVSDHYALDETGDRVSFVVVKRVAQEIGG